MCGFTDTCSRSILEIGNRNGGGRHTYEYTAARTIMDEGISRDQSEQFPPLHRAVRDDRGTAHRHHDRVRRRRSGGGACDDILPNRHDQHAAVRGTHHRRGEQAKTHAHRTPRVLLRNGGVCLCRIAVGNLRAAAAARRDLRCVDDNGGDARGNDAPGGAQGRGHRLFRPLDESRHGRGAARRSAAARVFFRCDALCPARRARRLCDRGEFIPSAG